jgi:hypothetical protein
VITPTQIEFIAAVADVFQDAEPGTRRWFHDPDFDVYLRMGPREFYGNRYFALTIADVTVKEGRRGCGVLAGLLLDLECCARLMGCDALFLENVRPELMNPLAKRRFWPRMNDGGYFDMLKELS